MQNFLERGPSIAGRMLPFYQVYNCRISLEPSNSTLRAFKTETSYFKLSEFSASIELEFEEKYGVQSSESVSQKNK